MVRTRGGDLNMCEKVRWNFSYIRYTLTPGIISFADRDARPDVAQTARRTLVQEV